MACNHAALFSITKFRDPKSNRPGIPSPIARGSQVQSPGAASKSGRPGPRPDPSQSKLAILDVAGSAAIALTCFSALSTTKLSYSLSDFAWGKLAAKVALSTVSRYIQQENRDFWKFPSMMESRKIQSRCFPNGRIIAIRRGRKGIILNSN